MFDLINSSKNIQYGVKLRYIWFRIVVENDYLGTRIKLLGGSVVFIRF
jgi:hypothetical protein